MDNANLTFLYPKPLASSSQIARDNYRQNILTVSRQVRYSQHNGNSVDLVIFLNGLAIITLELKSTHKNQTARFNAIEQYKKDYAEYWKEIIGVDGDFDLKAEKEEVE